MNEKYNAGTGAVKMKKRTKIYLAAFVALLITAVQAGAHNMWFDKTDKGFDFAYGHQGKTDPYDPGRVTDITGYTENGKQVPLKVIREITGDDKGVARAAAGDDIYLLAGRLDNNYWFHTEGGWENTDRREGLAEIKEEGKSYKLSKHIINWADYMTKPIGHRAEIVPLQDPTVLKEGQALIVQLFFDGKPMPLKEARVTMTSDSTIEDNELVYLTSSDPVEVKIGPPGLQLINAKFKLPVEGKEVVWFAFTLTFNTSQ